MLTTEQTTREVVIAGGGPTGLMLAGELALADIDVVVVEPRTSQEVESSRAGGLHARTLEVLDQRGIAERFVAAGQKRPALSYAGIELDISDFPTRHNYVLALWQSRFEPILADWVIRDWACRSCAAAPSPASTRTGPGSWSRSRTGTGSAPSTWSAATADAASCARRRASASRGRTRRPVG